MEEDSQEINDQALNFSILFKEEEWPYQKINVIPCDLKSLSWYSYGSLYFIHQFDDTGVLCNEHANQLVSQALSAAYPQVISMKYPIGYIMKLFHP